MSCDQAWKLWKMPQIVNHVYRFSWDVSPLQAQIQTFPKSPNMFFCDLLALSTLGWSACIFGFGVKDLGKPVLPLWKTKHRASNTANFTECTAVWRYELKAFKNPWRTVCVKDFTHQSAADCGCEWGFVLVNQGRRPTETSCPLFQRHSERSARKKQWIRATHAATETQGHDHVYSNG